MRHSQGPLGDESVTLDVTPATSESRHDQDSDALWEKEAPKDTIEEGACGLFLQAVWEHSRQPVSTHFQLYRLEVPGSEMYSAERDVLGVRRLHDGDHDGRRQVDLGAYERLPAEALDPQ
ncbi:MAG: hypothetical protein ACI9F9_001241 [Candidatus Paceibacteria bacterium]|jgi:hypothetical protein